MNDQLRRQEIDQALNRMDELKGLLQQKRGRIAVFDEAIAGMQQQRAVARRECFEIEQTILGSLTRVVALKVEEAEPHRPSLLHRDNRDRDLAAG